MTYVWDQDAWADYEWWQTQDRKIPRRINTLLSNIARNGNEGIGKPDPLEHGFQGCWSRRITDEHRLVYRIAGEEIRIASCRYHYGSWSRSSAPAQGRHSEVPDRWTTCFRHGQDVPAVPSLR